MYQIQYTYETGGEGGDFCFTKLLEFEWEKIEVAKENLNRIKNHYLWYYNVVGRFRNSHTKLDFVAKDEPWFVPNAGKDRLKLLCDDGQEIEISAPWCGHFELLIRAYITAPEWRIEF